MKTIYVSGKYTDTTEKAVENNIKLAGILAHELWKMGFGVFCPHMNSAHFDDVDYERFMEFDLLIVLKLDTMLMAPNWKDSKGAIREHSLAQQMGIPIFYSLEEARRWLEARK